LQNATGSENVFPTRNAWCAFRTHFQNQFQPVMLSSKRRILLSSSHGCLILNVFIAHSSFLQVACGVLTGVLHCTQPAQQADIES
jgi:hypothetical protein